MAIDQTKKLDQIGKSVDDLKKQIKELKSELDSEGVPDEVKAEVAKKIDEILMPCCRCGDMWQNN